MGFIGYVTNWGTIGAIVNGTTRLATTYSDDAIVAKPRIYTSGTGVKVHYDGTSDALTVAGQVVQEFFDTAGPAFIQTMRGDLGAVGTLTMTEADGVGTHTATAILIKVMDTTPVQGNRDRVWCQCTWEILSEAWT
jgi:hypothetical protein